VYSFTLKKKAITKAHEAATAGPSTYQEPPAPGEYDTFVIKHRLLHLDSSALRHKNAKSEGGRDVMVFFNKNYNYARS
jgi:hypothetical protein